MPGVRKGCVGCVGLVVAIVVLSVVLTALGATPPVRVEDQLGSASSGLRGAASALDPSRRPTPTAAVVWIGTPGPR